MRFLCGDAGAVPVLVAADDGSIAESALVIFRYEGRKLVSLFDSVLTRVIFEASKAA
jgi:hypothetical protein